MCGIVGIARTIGTTRAADDRAVERMRDRLAHRGPDGAGLFSEPHLAIGHRLLAIRDPGSGSQPFVIRGADGTVRLVLAFNGELYNAANLRRILESEGTVFRTNCDTEVLAHALDRWGTEALPRIRGMFALAAYMPADQRLLLARDPLGIKPLLYAHVPGAEGGELVFASEPAAILDHPDMGIAPDWHTVSAYLSTIRLTLGNRTLFDGMRTLRPGELMLLNLREERLKPRLHIWHTHKPRTDLNMSDPQALLDQTRAVITDSVRSHLVADQPVCTMLSGGLDSTIMTAIASRHQSPLDSWCTGARDMIDEEDDFAYAARAALAIGTAHHECPVDQSDFSERWPAMMHAMCLPLSTPNETAINAISHAISSSAKVVLSGEGADELFAGYTAPQSAAIRYMAHPYTESGDPYDPEDFLTDLLSWIHPHTKATLLQPTVLAAADHDRSLRHEMSILAHDAGGGLTDLDGFLRAQRAYNLPGLLGRLDSATMLASIEGRTPFADIAVADLAASIPGTMQFESHTRCDAGSLAHGGIATATITTITGKRILRDAFRSAIPQDIAMRPKVSFPLPFAQWMQDMTPVLESSGPVAEVFSEPALRMIARDPAHHWQMAWPVMNIACWLRIMWG